MTNIKIITHIKPNPIQEPPQEKKVACLITYYNYYNIHNLSNLTFLFLWSCIPCGVWELRQNGLAAKNRELPHVESPGGTSSYIVV